MRDIRSFFFGKKQYTFYFQTLTFGDSLLSLWFFFLQLIGLNKSRNSRELFLDAVYKLFKFKKGFLYGSARSSLFALLKTLRFDDGSEVLVTGFTCEVVPNAVINAGYTPIYVDINPVNYCMDPTVVKKLITKKTKVIIIQHTFGIPAQIEELIVIAKKHNLFIIEDCAVSLGSKYKGKLTGTFGDAAIFSFELSKTITSCRGGMLLLNTNKDSIIEKMIELYKKVPEQKRGQKLKTLFQLGISGILYRPRLYLLGKYIIALFFKLRIFSFSTTEAEETAKLPPNYLLRLSECQARIVLRQYLRLNNLIEKKIILKNHYLKILDKSLDKEFIQIVSSDEVVLLRFPFLTKKRISLESYFESVSIELGFWFTAPLSSKTINHSLFGYKWGCCPQAEEISKLIVNLPVSFSNNEVQKTKLKKVVNINNG